MFEELTLCKRLYENSSEKQSCGKLICTTGGAWIYLGKSETEIMNMHARKSWQLTRYCFYLYWIQERRHKPVKLPTSEDATETGVLVPVMWIFKVFVFELWKWLIQIPGILDPTGEKKVALYQIIVPVWFLRFSRRRNEAGAGREVSLEPWNSMTV